MDKKMKEKLAELLNKSVEEIDKLVKEKQSDLAGLINEEGAVILVGQDYDIKESELKIKNKIKSDNKKMDLEDFFQELDIKAEEFPDFLRVQNGILFTLRLEDPSKKPRKYKDNYKNEKWSWNVVLVDIEPEEAKKDYLLNKTYSLSLGKRAMRRFKQFWLSEGNQYEKNFTFERTGEKFQTDYKFKLVE